MYIAFLISDFQFCRKMKIFVKITFKMLYYFYFGVNNIIFIAFYYNKNKYNYLY